MSALGELASAAGGVVTGAIWKLATVGALLLAVGAGANWWLAARDRDQARVDLALERNHTAELTASVREQNRAVGALALATTDARARGAAAQAQAAADGRRYDGALAQIIAARGNTCDEAMPAVNALLEAVR